MGILLQRYTLLLLGVCMKYLKNEEEAKDCVQQVFLKAITELQKYKVDYFKSWLYMVAKNNCLMRLRSRGKETVELTEQLLSTPYEPGEAAKQVEKEAVLSSMENALHELNQEQQQCIRLFYLEKKSYQDIAGQTGYSLLKVKSYIQNGKRNLKMIMERLQQNEK